MDRSILYINTALSVVSYVGAAVFFRFDIEECLDGLLFFRGQGVKARMTRQSSSVMGAQ